MRTAMQNLHQRWGLSTADIARALRITERVARLARDGSAPAEGAEHLDTYLERLHVERNIDEPAAWMGARIFEGYTVTRWDLYGGGHADLVMLNARGLLNDESMLASFDPDWRRTYWTSFTTVEAEDGGTSIMGKCYDEVLGQIDPRDVR